LTDSINLQHFFEPIFPTKIRPYSKFQKLLSLTIVFLLFSGFAIRGIHRKAFWSDEVWSLYYAGAFHESPIGLDETIVRVLGQSRHENNPPGYYLLLNLWNRLAGDSELAMRMLSVLIGLLTVACCSRMAYEFAEYTRLDNANIIGWGAGLITASGVFLIYYGQEVRAYILLIGLVAFVTCQYFRLLRISKPSLVGKVAFVAGVTVLAYTHFFGLIALGWLIIFHLLFVPKNRHWLEIVLLMVTGGALFLPWAGVFLSNASRVNSSARFATLEWYDLPRVILYAFTTNNLTLFLLLWLGAIRSTPHKLRKLIFLIGVAAGSLTLLDAVVPLIAHVRYTVIIWPWLALLSAVGVRWLRNARLSISLLTAFFFGIALFNLLQPGFITSLHDFYNGTRMPWQQFTQILQAYIQPKDGVYFHAPVAEGPQGWEFAYYLAEVASVPERHSLIEAILGLRANDEYFNSARQAIAGQSRVWLGVDQTHAPNFRLGEFERALDERFDSCGNIYDDSAMRLELHAQPLIDPPIRFENGIGAQITIPEEAIRTSSDLYVIVQFTDQIPENTLSLGLHLEDTTGAIRAQYDGALPSTAHSCQLVRLDISSMPAGDYTLFFTVYNWQTQTRLESKSGNIQPDKRILIGKVHL